MCPKSRISVFVRLNLFTCVISSEALTVDDAGGVRTL